MQTPEGYLALPATGSGRPVLVLHAWWGVNDTIRHVCQQLADAGFVAFAPDLYHGKVAANIGDAERLGAALDLAHEQAKAEIAAATSFLNARSDGAHRVAVIGFSLGAYYALDAAAALPNGIDSVVLFYGTGGADHVQSQARYLGHFADSDPFEPDSNVGTLEAALRKAGRAVTFHRYEGTGHWFFEPDRIDAFDEAAAALAWQRTLQFLGS